MLIVFYSVHSEARQELDSDGSKWFVGPLREAEVDSRLRQRQEENKNYQGLLEPSMERANCVVSAS